MTSGAAAGTGTAPDIGPKTDPLTPDADGPHSHPDGPPPVDYGAGFLRTSIFCLIFLLLLPFFASLPAMIGMRASAGLLGSDWGIIVLAIMFSLLMFLIIVEMIFSIRTRVHLGRQKATMTLPAGRGPTPMLRYRSYEFPYDQVHSVETRREIYGGWLTPVLLKGARVTLKDGTVIPLGYVSDMEDDAVFPYPEIAHQIAERARLPLIDRGAVHRSVHRKLMGLKAVGTENDVVENHHIDALNRQHSNFMFVIIGGIAILMLIGIVQDLSSGMPGI